MTESINFIAQPFLFDFLNKRNPRTRLWVTDGSDDSTPEFLKIFTDVSLIHKPERTAKIAAMNRGMKYVKTPIAIFLDGNTNLGEDSIKEIVRLFKKLR
ncbi:MAG: cellulose synthase/poly-beta-1,6-N-acetylglucosamine synthase-like glycosyltransferase [Clostridium sp.]|jgi:cellulose synthase/poly-beta-1,6-N-acetylglucosamine synthase-like glycosyltransferase